MQQTKDVTIQQVAPITVAYIRHVGPFQGDGALFLRLIGQIHDWAKARNLMTEHTDTIAIYHDDPCVVEASKLRLSIGINVAADTQVNGDVGKLVLEGGEYAVGSFELTPPEFPAAWGKVFGSLAAQGYQPAQAPGFEIYPFQQPQNGQLVADICVPVKPL